MTEPVPPRPFDYAAFIAELRELIERARHFRKEVERYDTPTFRAWKHTLSDLLYRAQRLHRRPINTRFHDREFRLLAHTASEDDDALIFHRELTDTLIELDLVVQNYDKYGDPMAGLKLTPVPSTPGAPVQVTNFGTMHEIVHNSLDAGAPEQKKELEPPEKVTLYWIFKHMSIGGWGTLIGLLAAAYALGASMGAWPLTQKLLTKYLGL